jgi:leucyl-tRNA synthetase
MVFYLIINHIHSYNIKPQQLTYEFFDYVLLDIGDVDKIAKKTKITKNVLLAMRREVEYWYPNDLRHTAISHITNHLSFFIFHHTAIFPERYWPLAITINEHVNREGKKMSKSKGNVIPMAEIPQRFGADLYRLYISQIGDLQTLVDWQDKDVVTIQRRLNRLIRILEEASTQKEAPIEKEQLSITGQWILSKINSTIRTATEALDNFRFRNYILDASFQLLSHVEFYLNRTGKNHPERSPVLRYIAERWTKLLAPVMPHLCEEIWEKMGNVSFVSLEKWPEPEVQFLNEKIEDAMQVVVQTIADIKEIKGLLRSKRTNAVHIYVSPNWKYKALTALKTSKAAFTMKSLMSIIMQDPEIQRHGKAASELVQAVIKTGGYWTFIDKETELKVLRDSQAFIQSETGLTVSIQDADNPSEDPEERAPKALPGRPALYLA